jgi:peptidylprolyl isomerase
LFPSLNLKQQPSDIYALPALRNITGGLPLKGPLDFAGSELSSELCLLRLLPVKNPFFRDLQSVIEGLSALGGSTPDADSWRQANRKILDAVNKLDKKRGMLQPVFNPEESTLIQIFKGERFEILIETLRNTLLDLATATKASSSTLAFSKQKAALLTLSEIGELLVMGFTYDVPTEGKYSYLPRLLGRAKVTFTFRRANKQLGNVTIVADGFAAPITAGNFVDLSARGFYTGLPIKFIRQRTGSGSDFEVATLPIMGSYREGFYDPLTAKPRRLPLEIIRVEKGSNAPRLTYTQGLSTLSASPLKPASSSKPLLSFKIPGLVAMYHPDWNQNGASAEFFSLQKDSMVEEKRAFLDGEYAPFGYIIEGYDLFQELQPNDVIDTTYVDEWGQLNLVKIRRSSFSEVVQGSEKEESSL